MARSKSAARKSAGKKAAKTRKPRAAGKKAAKARKRPAAKKKTVATRKGRPAARKASPSRKTNAAATAAAMPTTELDSRIAIVRANLRELVEQAASYSGAADEERMSERIAEREATLALLMKQRDALSRRGS